VTFPGFLALGWWQLHRALGGNELSWAYTVEWPLFSGYSVFMWWKLLHEAPDAPSSAQASLPPPEEDATELGPGKDAAAEPARAGARPPGRRPAEGAARQAAEPEDEDLDAALEAYNTYAAEPEDEDLDAALEAYNTYLAQLNLQGGRKSWRRG
jgi:hypothetical protein